MIERRAVLRDHVAALIGLAVGEDQRGLVAVNAVTLAQAAYEPGARVWGLWEGSTVVGLMAMIDPRQADLDPGDDPEAAYLWRLMIGAAHQGRGFGAAALAEAEAQARLWGLPRLAASVVERDGSALPFHLRYGFRRTGRTIDGEAEIVRDLAPLSTHS
jgi:diamine N-acetyltransferase